MHYLHNLKSTKVIKNRDSYLKQLEGDVYASDSDDTDIVITEH